MPNAGGVDFSSSINVAADLYVGSFLKANADGGSGDSGSESFAVELRIADRIQLQGGEEFSYAIVSIPEDAFPNDENAFAVALKRGGIMERIKPGSRASVSHVLNGKATVILVGTVIEPTHDIKVDAGSLLIACDKFELSKITCWGQLQYDPNTGIHSFSAVDECVFNQFGWPNCLDAPKGKVRFAPGPRYGWLPGQTVEPLPGKATTRARSWRPVDVISYLRDVHYNGVGWPGTGIQNYGNRFLDTSHVVWPANLGAGLRDRVLHDFSIENLTLLEALQKIASHCGAFDVYMIPGGHGGDNGNDIAAGMASEGIGDYLSLQTVFDNQAAALQTGFNNGMAAFQAVLGSSIQSLRAAISEYTKASGGLPYPVDDVGALFDNVSFQYARDGTLNNPAAYQALVQMMGAILNGDKARYL